jgi:hypothetical protein
VKIKMTQAYEKQSFEIEIEIEEQEQKPAQNSNEKKPEILGELNPRYFERVMTLKQAKQKLWAKYGDLQLF